MAFRARNVGVQVATAAPTESIEVGDPFVTGGLGLAADAGHGHAFSAPALMGALAPGGLADISADYVAQDDAVALLGPGAALDLSVYFAGLPVAGDGVQYVAQGGDDTEDGRSWGSAKATVGAALLALPAGGGIIFVGEGTWVISAPLALGPNTTIEGRGQDVTTLQLDPTAWANFHFNYLITTSAADQPGCTVRDLTLDGNHRAGGAGADQGGCITPGSHWLVERVRLHDCNYFKVFIANKTGATIRSCKFTGYQGNDNIGGGGQAGLGVNHGVTVEDCYFAADISGTNNAIDFTNGDGYVIRNNRVDTPRNIILEGCTDSVVDGNYLAGGLLMNQDDSGYSPATVVMPRHNRIVNNEIDSPTQTAIRIRYLDWAGATARTPGGGNIVANNVVRNTQTTAIVIDGYDAAFKTRPDSIVGNHIDGTNLGGANTSNTGTGLVQNAGIVLLLAAGDVVEGNTICDSQAVPTMRYGIALSGSAVGAPATVVGALVQGNTIRNATIAGIIVSNAARVDAATAIRDNLGYNPLGAANAVVGASPWTYTCGHTPEVLHLRGGTITTVVKDGVTLYAATDVAVALEPGEQVTVTYTVAPTATADRK